MGSRGGEGVLPLCTALVRPQLEHGIQLWEPQHRQDRDLMDVLEQVQREATEIIRGIEHFSYNKRVRKLVFSLEKRMLCGNLTAALLCYLKEPYKKTGEGPFIRAYSDIKRDNGYKPKKSRFSLDEVLALLVLVRH